MAVVKKQTAVEVIEGHKGKVNKALEVFTDAYQSIEKTQEQLGALIDSLEDEQSTIAHALKKAYDEFAYNEKLKVQLGQFRPESLRDSNDTTVK